MPIPGKQTKIKLDGMGRLPQNKKENLIKYLSQFEARLKKELSSGGWKKERSEREKWFKKSFSKRSVKHLSEKEFERIIKSLWASNVWSEKGKDYLSKKIIRENKLTKLRNSFYDLFYRGNDLASRYEECKTGIKGVGDSSLTEIMAFVDSKKYCIWNDKPKTVLPFLGLEDQLPSRAFKYSLRGSDYVSCLELLDKIKIEMENFGFGSCDFLDVDILMWLIFSEADISKLSVKESPREEIEQVGLPEIRSNELDHWDGIAVIGKLGLLLGFEVFVANPSKRSKTFNTALIKIGKSTKELPEELKGIKDIERIDTIWVPRSGAFEKIYLFEIEDKGTMREALHRLYQALLLEAKMFVIGPEKNRSKFDRWSQTEPFSSFAFKNKCKYKNFGELVDFYQKAKEYIDSKGAFLSE